MNNYLILFMILLLGLVFSSFLGGKNIRDGFKSNEKSHGKSKDKSDEKIPTKFYSSSGESAELKKVNGAYIIIVKNKDGSTTIYTVKINHHENHNPDSLVNKIFYGPNGGYARIFESNDGKIAIEITSPHGQINIYTDKETYHFNPLSESGTTCGDKCHHTKYEEASDSDEEGEGNSGKEGFTSQQLQDEISRENSDLQGEKYNIEYLQQQEQKLRQTLKEKQIKMEEKHNQMKEKSKDAEDKKEKMHESKSKSEKHQRTADKEHEDAVNEHVKAKEEHKKAMSESEYMKQLHDEVVKKIKDAKNSQHYGDSEHSSNYHKRHIKHHVKDHNDYSVHKYTIPPSSNYDSSYPPGIHKHMIPDGEDDLYILKSQIVPPVCPACPQICPNPPRPPPPPPPPNGSSYYGNSYGNSGTYNIGYETEQQGNIPVPVLNNFSTFGM